MGFWQPSGNTLIGFGMPSDGLPILGRFDQNDMDTDWLSKSFGKLL
jgi:hypothetical protein